MAPVKVVLSQSIEGWSDAEFESARFARERGVQLVSQNEAFLASPDWIRANLYGATALCLWTIGKQLSTSEIIDIAGPNLKFIVLSSVGFDAIDLELCKKHGVQVANSPSRIVEPTAQTAALLTHMAMRLVKPAMEEVTSGKWLKTGLSVRAHLGHSLRGATIGVVGFGRIGQLTFQLLQAYAPGRLLYLNSQPGREAKDLVGAIASSTCPVEPATSADQLAHESDLLLVCVNLSPSTKHLIDAAFLRKMKPNATVVNVGRGAVVDSEALADALEEDRIFAAGLDVIEGEFTASACRRLIEHPRAIVLPHVGSAVKEDRIAALDGAVLKTLKAALGAELADRVA